MVSAPVMREVWTEERMLRNWIDLERPITVAQAELGMVPKEAAEKILAKLSLEHLRIEQINERRETIVHLMVAFLKAIREACGPAAEHFHVGPTTQDILPTVFVYSNSLLSVFRGALRFLRSKLLRES